MGTFLPGIAFYLQRNPTICDLDCYIWKHSDLYGDYKGYFMKSSISGISNVCKSRMSFILIFCLVLISISFLAACSSPGPQPTQINTETSTPETPPTPAPTFMPVIDAGQELAPSVVNRTPAGGASAGLNGPVELEFDADMDQASVNKAFVVNAFVGSETASKPVGGQMEWTDSRHVQFSPAEPFQAGTRYIVSLSEQAASIRGKGLREAYQFSFTTAQSLAVGQVIPADGSSEIGLNSSITVVFNRPVVPLVIAEQQAGLPQPLTFEPAVEGTGEWINTSVYVFRPAKNLQGGVAYQATVAKGLTDAQSETQLTEPFRWSFTTAMPSIEGFSFKDYAWENYPSPKNSVKLQQSFFFVFRQAMDRVSTEANLKISSLGGESVPLEFEWRENDTQVYFTPTVRMSLSTHYQINLDKAAQVEGGGTGLDYSFTYEFKTVDYPGILWTAPANGEIRSQYDSSFTIYFASPMKFETWKDRISFSPEPPEGWTWYYNADDYYGEQWSLSMYGLESSTDYTVKIDPGMQDLYGNEIQESKTIQFRTAPYPPTAFFQLPQGLVLYRAGGSQDFYIGLRNINRAEARMYSLSVETYAALHDYTSGINEYNFVPSEESLIWSKSVNLAAQADRRKLELFSPYSPGEDKLTPGLYYLVLDAPQVESYGNPFTDRRIVMVASASLTLKVSPTEALAWLTDLKTGEPVGNQLVIFYDYLYHEIGRANTDSDGIAMVRDLSLDIGANGTVYAQVVTNDEFAFTSSSWGSGVSPYDFGIWQDYYTQPNHERAYLYTDRPLYRPGQPVYFKGVIRTDDDGLLSLPSTRLAQVVILNYEGTVVYSQTLPVNGFGTFNGKFEIDQNAVLGGYTLNVYRSDAKDSVYGPYSGSLGFSVAEYKKPEFIVDVSGNPSKALEGENIDFSIQADYYAGGPLVDASVYWNLQSVPYTFVPPDDFSGYSFSDGEWDIAWDYFGENQVANSLAEGESRTTDAGKAVVSVPASLGDKGSSQTLILESGVTDFAGVSVYGRSEVVVHRSQVYPGIRSQTYVVEANKKAGFDLVALDWEQNALPGQKVDIEVVERRWNNVQTVDVDGRVKWESTVEEIPVTAVSGLVLDSKGKGLFSFTPDRGGVFRIKIKSLDAKGNLGYASVYVWAAGQDYIPWRQAENKSFDLIKDKTEYVPGEAASIMIASPFDDPVYALITVERGHIRNSEVVRLTTNSTVYRLPITAEMAPGVYISVLLIRTAPDLPPDFRMGMTEIKVKTTEQALTVSLESDVSETSPGNTVNYTVRVQDSKGNPVQAEVSLSLSDLAALNLAEANSGPILDFFYFKRNLGVTTSVPLVFSVEDYNAKLAKDSSALGYGMGSGGGKGEGDTGVIAVRGNFLDTAFWQADLVTGADGTARAAVTLPDNLTIWRMDARALTVEMLAGQTTYDLTSTRPLLVRPQTPRFFTIGDEAVVGAAVHNNTGMDLTVIVKLQAQGVAVLDAVEQQITLANGAQSFVTWHVKVEDQAERVDLIFSAEGGPFSDASRPPLGTLENQGIPVYRYEAPENVGTSGQLLEPGTIVESLMLPSGWDIQQAVLDIQIAPSLAAGMTDGLAYLENYPYACIEQTISRFLPNVVTTRALIDAGIRNPELENKLRDNVNLALQKLASQQGPDGGWGWWSTQDSDPTTTAYAVIGLVEASEAGYSVDAGMLAGALDFLNQRTQLSLDGQKIDPNILNQQGFMLYALSRAGSPKTSTMVRLYDNYRQDLALYVRALLAESFWRQNTGDERINTLVSDLSSQAVLSATGTHWEEPTPDIFNWNTDVRTTAIVIEALSQIDPQNILNANGIRWLMSHRNSGHWASTQETAWTLLALTRWMANSGELSANYQYAVAFNGQTIGGGNANSENLREVLDLSVDITQMLKQEQNRLAIARSEGPGNLYYTANLRINLPVDQIQALDRGIQVQRQYYTLTDLKSPVLQANQGDLLLVKLTISSPSALHYVVIDDALPAGFEAIDSSLKTSPTPTIPLGYVPENDWWGWWYFEHVEMRDEKVVLSARYLPAGSYTYTYLVRASTPGVFRVVPSTAQEIYFPEVYGRGEGSQFTVLP